eukprot:maker-scaffold99_size374999-snap-gene-1.9 protein:Tk10056 transcript:maker-scaffold99_size374999-snap-gene-1.9-mRNA-1 annotation:"---NA---"
MASTGATSGEALEVIASPVLAATRPPDPPPSLAGTASSPSVASPQVEPASASESTTPLVSPTPVPGLGPLGPTWTLSASGPVIGLSPIELATSQSQATVTALGSQFVTTTLDVEAIKRSPTRTLSASTTSNNSPNGALSLAGDASGGARGSKNNAPLVTIPENWDSIEVSQDTPPGGVAAMGSHGAGAHSRTTEAPLDEEDSDDSGSDDSCSHSDDDSDDTGSEDENSGSSSSSCSSDDGDSDSGSSSSYCSDSNCSKQNICSASKKTSKANNSHAVKRPVGPATLKEEPKDASESETFSKPYPPKLMGGSLSGHSRLQAGSTSKISAKTSYLTENKTTKTTKVRTEVQLMAKRTIKTVVSTNIGVSFGSFQAGFSGDRRFASSDK